jgi:hypothetical protein
MVVIEEVDEQEETTDTRAPRVETGDETAPKPAKKVGFKKGFLEESGEALYPEGSPEGEVSEEVKKARMEQATQKKLDDMQGPKKGAPVPGENEPEAPPPPWYTPEWPKTCQYNTPGCTLYYMGSSGNSTDMHKQMVRKSDRWEKAISGTEKDIRLSFSSMVDEDLDLLLEHVRNSDVVREIDISHNDIQDIGVQKLVTVLADAKALPNLETLRIYKNCFTSLGETMVTQGLAVFRPKLKVVLEPPLYTFQQQNGAGDS